jgi:hypothetical protein
MWKNMVLPDRAQIKCNTTHALWLTTVTDTLIICNTYCFSRTTMVTRTLLNGTSCVHGVSCFSKVHSNFML